MKYCPYMLKAHPFSVTAVSVNPWPAFRSGSRYSWRPSARRLAFAGVSPRAPAGGRGLPDSYCPLGGSRFGVGGWLACPSERPSVCIRNQQGK